MNGGFDDNTIDSWWFPSKSFGVSKVTMRMIAKEAGVSVSTVSMALRGIGTLSRSRCEQIQALADSMGYRPNPVLSSLAAKRFSDSAMLRSLPLALVEFPIDGQSGRRATFYREHLIDAASKLGYSLELFSPEEVGQYGNFLRTLYNRGVAGIVFTGQANAFMEREADEWRHFALVQCARFRGSPLVNCVRPNIFQAVTMAFRELWTRGYRRIGFGFGRHGFQLDDDDARFGAAYAMLCQQAESDRVPIYQGRFDDDEARIAWVREYRPEVVIGFSRRDYYVLRDAGFAMTRELGFVALSLDGAKKPEEQISGMFQQGEEIARECILLLDQLVRHKRQGMSERPLEILVPSRWFEGDTLRPRLT